MLASIFDVREALEGLAAKEAAARISNEELAALAESVRRHERQLEGSEPEQHNALGRADADFHFRIAQASGNPLLIDLLCNQLYPLLRLYRSRNDNRSLRQRALTEHQRVLSALSDHDPEMAELAMKRHIASAKVRRTMALQAGNNS
jgi:DNA-binding GntR family transcriptional regulator